jgi:uncharacterized protein CbrC (UPF0167 family)
MSTSIECPWQTEYWLRHCEGFRVFTPDGEVGFVEAVELKPDGDAAALVVRFGEMFTHDVIVPVDEVEEFDPVAERITIGPLAGSPHEEAARQLRIPATV